MGFEYQHIPLPPESERSCPRLAVITPELLEIIDECPKGSPTTYGATPLDMLTSIQQQRLVKQYLTSLTYEIPDGVPIEIAAPLHTTFGERFNSRAEANNENYTTALHFDERDKLDPAVQAMLAKAETGNASPAELLIVRNELGIRSVELACLTHPYGGEQLRDYLQQMRDAVECAVTIFDGEYDKNPTPVYKVKEAISVDETANSLDLGVVMTRKKIIGALSDGTTIKERSSFILRTDADAPLSEAQREAIKAIDMSDPEWQSHFMQVEGMQEYISHLLASESHTMAIPISTTIYAFNTQTAKRVLERAAVMAEQREREEREQKERLAALIEESKAGASGEELEARIKQSEALFDSMPIFGREKVWESIDEFNEAKKLTTDFGD